MKLKNLISIYGVLLLSTIGIISCVKDTDYELPNLEDLKKDIPSFDGNIVTFAQATASATTNVTPYTSNDAIEGYVVSSDEGGNFYKKIYIQNADKTAGVSVSINKSGLYTEFPVGAKVQIRLKGLTTQINNGGLEIGYDIYTSGSGRKSVGQMAEAIYKKHIYNLQEPLKTRAELTKSDTSIDVLKTNANVNQLITLKNVSFESNASGKTYHIVANDKQNGTNYNLIDANGKTITFRTSKYAKFINETVASGLLDVTGVLTKFGSTYQFMINNPKEDIISVGGGSNSETTTVTELEDSKATSSDYAVGKKVKLHGKIVIDKNKPHFRLSDGTMIQIFASSAVFKNLSEEVKNKLKLEGQEITVTGTFKDYTNPKTNATIKEIVYEKEADLVFGATPDNNDGGNSGGTNSQGNTFDFENLTTTGSNSNKYTNTGNLTVGNVTISYKARLDMDKFAINGKGLMLHNKDNPYIKITFSKGVKILKFKYKAAYNSKERKLVIYEGDETSNKKLSEVSIPKDGSGTHTMNINKNGSVTITIKSTQGQVVIDDFEWTE
ncbi:DUF5689 domain-containing protein [Capnocytophaga felis]|uniref:DUF5689 domain-containing protein n=1 Tax=Capnocytophaga felis TaxID=2267611 RepID=A0A5M4B6J2_9FLAO|nr:DUF5689 domain-containing protein [Capnocytophaga felis]GET45233.1 hypothetical protein RCZ01_05350 [Capnocytophaga felis]GET47604.1 hypothetical protein RCZ02_04350 [Capnocytophaga felis]